MRKYWELWKDALAAWAAIAIIFYIIALALGMELIPAQLLYKLQLCFLISVFFPYLAALPFKIRPNWWTEHRRLTFAIVCVALALILLIVCVIYRQTLSTWPYIVIIALALGATAIVYAFMPVQRQPRQPEEPPSKAKEREKAPRTPKPERAKIIGLAALRGMMRALEDWIFEWWRMWKNLLAGLATISAIAYTLADLVFHIDTARIGELMAKYSELALILVVAAFVITLAFYGIRSLVRRNKYSGCKTK
ncbi:MAG: hypothetical protein FJ023_09505 [Chloroflexi bacterium]|nr:hypothetical protein [Chloroflexota bacterium]